MANWNFEGKEFASCNCAYGCPCQFNALPTHGNCKAFQAIHIEKGQHGSTSLDGLRTVALFAWPGAVHEGNGEAQLIIEVECAPDGGQFQAAFLTGCWAWRSSYCAGVR